MDMKPVKVREDVVSRVLDGEAVLLDLASGSYFGLNEVGTVVWEELRTHGEVAKAVDKVLEEFEVDRETAERDVSELVTELLDKKLLQSA